MSSSFDTSIPVLTEILYVADNAKIEPEAQPPIVARAAIEAAGPPLQTSDAQEWNAPEQQLATRILSQLQQQLPVVLEQRMSELLRGLNQQICADLQADLTRIVAQEMAQMKTEMKTGKP
jgi:hypothetical protein